MSKPSQIGSLQVHQDLPHEKREWRIERAGWIAGALVLLAALAGLLGPGPLSSTAAGLPGSDLWVQYNRFARYQAPEILRVHLGPGALRAQQVRLSLSRDYVKNIELTHIDPEPERVDAGPEALIYTFNISQRQAPVMLSFHFQPNHFGTLPATLAVDDGPRVAFSQFVYP
jgi:hypothetical protein